MRRAPLVPHISSLETLDEGAARARVVEMDVGQEQRSGSCSSPPMSVSMQLQGPGRSAPCQLQQPSRALAEVRPSISAAPCS